MNRDGPELEPLISFIRYYIGDPAYTSLLTSVTHEILGTNYERG